jgi:NAD(P)-dependent dehydrogenase (short-subunit alcohol dehydrogenase family)
VTALVAQVGAELGPPAILVNAAGVFGPIALIPDTDPEAWIATQRVNVLGPYLTARAVLPAMLASGWGRIVNVTSAAALHPPGPLNSAYGTSKVALNQLTRHLAAEIEGSGVTANVLHPGDVKTEMWADIREQCAALGERGGAYRQWVEWVEETGGDPPEKAAERVVEIVTDASGTPNGRFLWVREPLQAPIASWGDEDEAAAVEAQPWR